MSFCELKTKHGSRGTPRGYLWEDVSRWRYSKGRRNLDLPQRVTVSEVAPRDGLQIEKKLLTTAEKVALIEAICRSGVPKVEVASFVDPRLVPQMAGAEVLIRNLPRFPGTRFSVLIPNIRGLERALKCGVREVKLVVSASESHNRANVRMSVADSLANIAAIMRDAAGGGVRVTGGLGTAFGCPFEGRVPVDKVLGIIGRMVDLGLRDVLLADTTGMANPLQVEGLVWNIRERWPGLHLILHLHNTRGSGMANVLAGLQAGVDEFEGSAGGIGGCPFAPGASGNVCTEDMVHMFHEMGIRTGIDLDRLIAAARLAGDLLDHPLPGQVMKAGKNSDLHPVAAAP